MAKIAAKNTTWVSTAPVPPPGGVAEASAISAAWRASMEGQASGSESSGETPTDDTGPSEDLQVGLCARRGSTGRSDPAPSLTHAVSSTIRGLRLRLDGL